MIRSSVAKGTVTAPPSKSFTHRAMLLGALTGSRFFLKNPLVSDDTNATLNNNAKSRLRCECCTVKSSPRAK